MAITLKRVLSSLDNVLADLEELRTNRSFDETETEIGHTFTKAGVQWKILDIVGEGYLCLAEKLDSRRFDPNSNNWEASELRKYLNGEFYERLAVEVGEENIIPFTRNLLSLDGQTEYGICEDKVSLLTIDEYRRYRRLIPNANYWWWLISPWSTKCNGYTDWSSVVSPRGIVDGCYCVNSGGVRPFCIFSSTIFESKGE